MNPNPEEATRTFTDLKLIPVIHERDGRVHAAFRIEIQLHMRGSVTAIVGGNILRLIDRHLERIAATNQHADDPMGTKCLSACGVPPTYASTFDELKAFLGGSNFAELLDVGFKDGGVVNFHLKARDPAPLDAPAVSMSLLYNGQLLKHNPTGNYHEIMAGYLHEDVRIVEARLNTERGDYMLSVALPESHPDFEHYEFRDATFTLAFTIIDQRQAASV